MTQLISHSELLQRAVVYISEKRKEFPDRPLAEILDQAGMQFNLTPLDTEALQRLFTADKESA